MQLSADIKMKNYKMKTSFVSPEMPKTWAIKTDFNIMIRTSFNPSDIKRFRSHNGKKFLKHTSFFESNNNNNKHTLSVISLKDKHTK